MNLDKGYEAARRAVESRYDGVMTVTEYKGIKDPKTKRTTQLEVDVITGQPCHLSFKSIPSANQTETGAAVTQTIKLFFAPETVIEPGSRITVTQQGRTAAYAFSGLPAVYRTQQTVELKSWEGWA